MNHKYLVLLSALSIGNLQAAAAAATTSPCASHQYIPRGASTDLVWIDAFNFYNRTKKHPEAVYLFSSTTIYQKSRKSDRFASAFLLGNGSNTISAVQGGSATAINSLELQIPTPAVPALPAPFASTFSISPVSKQISYVGNMYVNLESWWCGLWGDFSFGVTNVQHKLNCEETSNTVAAVPQINTVGKALSNPTALLNSKFYCNNCRDGKRRTGLEDLQFRLGYDYKWCDDNRIGIYGIGTIPAGRRPTSEFIFEPLVGSKHGSVGVGFLGDYELWVGCDNESVLTLLSDFNYRYVLSHNECRTFDLTANGPMSRYLLLVSSTALGLPFPAANATTLDVNVSPRSTIQWWVALNYEFCNWDFEFGYDLFWRQKERLKSTTSVPFPTTLGVYNLAGAPASAVTASGTTIFAAGTPDAAFVPLTFADLNINSGLAGRVLSNKFYGAVSWDGTACNCFEWIAGFGGSYEFVSNHDKCNALPNWAIFSKFAVAF